MADQPDIIEIKEHNISKLIELKPKQTENMIK